MKKVILTLGEPNLNGRTYTKEVIENALQEFKGISMLVTDHLLEGPEINLEHVIGQVINNTVTETSWEGELQLINTEAAKKFANFAVRPSFIGNVAKDGSISNLAINYLFLTTDPA